MVTRNGKTFKTPPGSRGTSPSRNSNNSKSTSASSSRKDGKSPVRTTPERIRQSPDRRRKPTPERNVIRSRGNSPLKYREEQRSRGSE
ncbi:hypothetical protein NQ317_003411 [Molorchus minor]|uniref:Uncharacterized protein n=1 Tax=Molorchus minor TaxID=1323400 RepID=A0ABQ9JU62_9CUCU|nr:hypothetical protein NQ317_003411 [Molorchus minor]